MLIDDYVCDVLMRDLVGHDHQPTAFLVYLYLSYESGRSKRERVQIAEARRRLRAARRRRH